jgi:hypothetical protein
MSEIAIRPYAPERPEEWDAFVAQANEGTLFHRLDFLAYHGDRFRGQEYHLAWYKGEQLFAVMPAALFQDDGRRVARSPYGGSYGGPIFAKPVGYDDGRSVVRSLLHHLADVGVTACTLTLPIQCCYARYSDTFRFCLLEQGFRCVNRDVSSVVHLGGEGPGFRGGTSRSRNMARKAAKAGVVTAHRGSLTDFWAVLEMTYQKHGTAPTHTLQEYQWLARHFPEGVYADVAYLDGRPIAGAGCFIINRRVNSSFYLCQDPEFQNVQALSLLVSEALARSQDNGFRQFDFGTSSFRMQARDNIFRFKESFGAVGHFRETYLWEKSPAER